MQHVSGDRHVTVAAESELASPRVSSNPRWSAVVVYTSRRPVRREGVASRRQRPATLYQLDAVSLGRGAGSTGTWRGACAGVDAA